MELIGAAEDDDGVLLYPVELAAARAKSDRRGLRGFVDAGHLRERKDVAAIAAAHDGSGPKPQIAYLADDIERLRSEWFERHDAIDPDEVTGEPGTARAEALEALAAAGDNKAVFQSYLDSVHHMALALTSTCNAVGAGVGWKPAE